MVDAEKPEFADGRLGKALKLDGKAHADFGPLVRFERTNAFSYGAWMKLEGDGAVLSKMEKGPGYRGFDLFFADERFQMHLANVWPDNALKVRTKDKFPKSQWLHVLATYDGSGKAAGLKLYVNGRAREVEVEKNNLTNTIANDESLRIGARNGESILKGRVDDVRFYQDRKSVV